MSRLDRLILRTREWSQASADAKESFLAWGGVLDSFNQLAEQRPAWLSSANREFVSRSNQKQNSAREKDRRLNRNLKIIVAALVCALIGVAWFAYVGEQEAKQARGNLIGRADGFSQYGAEQTTEELIEGH